MIHDLLHCLLEVLDGRRRLGALLAFPDEVFRWIAASALDEPGRIGRSWLLLFRLERYRTRGRHCARLVLHSIICRESGGCLRLKRRKAFALDHFLRSRHTRTLEYCSSPLR